VAEILEETFAEYSRGRKLYAFKVEDFLSLRSLHPYAAFPEKGRDTSPSSSPTHVILLPDVPQRVDRTRTDLVFTISPTEFQRELIQFLSREFTRGVSGSEEPVPGAESQLALEQFLTPIPEPAPDVEDPVGALDEALMDLKTPLGDIMENRTNPGHQPDARALQRVLHRVDRAFELSFGFLLREARERVLREVHGCSLQDAGDAWRAPIRERQLEAYRQGLRLASGKVPEPPPGRR
jgi:hypothetical protein